MTARRDPWFVVPVGGVQTFCVVRDDRLVPVNPLPDIGDGEQAVDHGFGWVAWVPPGGREVRWTHLDAVDGEGRFPPLRMPEGYQAECLLFHRQVLFVGGNCGKEVIGSFDLADPEPRWTPLQLPEQLRRHGKRVDDLLLDGDELIAVDDHYVPKFLLIYNVAHNIADPRRPTLLETRPIPALWWGERIYAGAVGNNWLALLSVGGGTIVGSRMQIALYDRRTRGLYGRLAAYPERGSAGLGLIDRLGHVPRRTWNRIEFSGDVLLIAAGQDGVGLLDLSGIQRPASPVACDSAVLVPVGFEASHPEHQRFSEACESALRYVRPAGVTGPVVRVEPVPDARLCLAVCHTPAGLDTVVVTLP